MLFKYNFTAVTGITGMLLYTLCWQNTRNPGIQEYEFGNETRNTKQKEFDNPLDVERETGAETKDIDSTKDVESRGPANTFSSVIATFAVVIIFSCFLFH